METLDLHTIGYALLGILAVYLLAYLYTKFFNDDE